jgi:hypothetical protein
MSARDVRTGTAPGDPGGTGGIEWGAPDRAIAVEGDRSAAPSAHLRALVLAAAQREPAPTRGAVRARTAALLASGLVLPVVVFLLFGGLRASPRPGFLILGTAAGAAIMAAVALAIALSRGRSMLGRPGATLAAVVVVTPAVLLVWKMLVSSRYPGMTVEWPERIGLRCLRLSFLMAAWPLVAFPLARRGTAPTHPHLAGAAIGAATGAVVWVLVDLWCPVAYGPHLLLGHVAPALLATAAGAWLGGLVLGLPRRGV